MLTNDTTSDRVKKDQTWQTTNNLNNYQQQQQQQQNQQQQQKYNRPVLNSFYNPNFMQNQPIQQQVNYNGNYDINKNSQQHWQQSNQQTYGYGSVNSYHNPNQVIYNRYPYQGQGNQYTNPYYNFHPTRAPESKCLKLFITGDS